jgi:hypothetical protein
MDQFRAVKDPHRIDWWQVERVDCRGFRSVTPGHFRKERTAQAAAYKMEVAAEQRRNRRIYLGD